MPCDVDDELETGEDNGTWCYCKQLKGGDMVYCESSGCSIKCFHLECLQMAESPHGKLLCPTCHASIKKVENENASVDVQLQALLSTLILYNMLFVSLCIHQPVSYLSHVVVVPM